MNFSFEGRLNRQPYIIGYLTISIISGIITYLTKDSTSTLITIFAGIIGILLFIATLSLIIRRLHDLDKSGWLALVLLIPFIGFLFTETRRKAPCFSCGDIRHKNLLPAIKTSDIIFSDLYSIKMVGATTIAGDLVRPLF